MITIFNSNERVNLEQYFPNTQKSFSSVSDSIVRRVADLAIAIILLPLRLVQDMVLHTVQAGKKLIGRNIKPENPIMGKFISAADTAKVKMLNIARTSKDFAIRNKSTIKVALIGIGFLAIVGGCYKYPKIYSWLTSEKKSSDNAITAAIKNATGAKTSTSDSGFITTSLGVLGVLGGMAVLPLGFSKVLARTASGAKGVTEPTSGNAAKTTGKGSKRKKEADAAAAKKKADAAAAKKKADIKDSALTANGKGRVRCTIQ